MRLTKYQGENYLYRYINVDKSSGHEINVLLKLGQLEDLLDKYDIKTLEQVESAFISFVSDYTEEGRNHIGELLKLEDELGIDLITLFKALKGLIYKPTYKEMIKFCGGRYPRYEEGFCLKYNEPTNRYFLEVGSPLRKWQVLELKDYDKTWALTKEELE